MLAFDVDKRISCDALDKILAANHAAHNNSQLLDQSNLSKFLSILPSSEIPVQSFDCRNSQFYRS
jgi:hypothetical protein